MRAPISLLTLAFFSPVAAGCLSHEYVIPKSELARLADMPPGMRGQRVHAIQEIGERRGDPVPPPQQFEYAPEQAPDVNAEVQIDGSLNIGDIGPDGVVVRPGPGWRGPSSGGGAWHGSPPTSGAGGGWHGSPPAAGGGGWHGSPPAAGGGGGGWRGSSPSAGHGSGSSGLMPTSGGSGHGSGGGSSHGWSGGGGGGGGGGGNIGEAAVLLAVVLVAIAAIAVVGLVASEGVRFDGYVQMSPDQPVHLQRTYGGDLVIPLAQITPQDVNQCDEAKVMDDEGFGIVRLEHVLERRGAVFKLDFGRVAFEQATSTLAQSGPVAHIQLGYFINPLLGVLATAGLSGADDGLGSILTRHEFSLELQSFPIALGPLHLGGYANGGFALAGTTEGTGTVEYGSAFGAGALIELDLTGRLALTLRGGGDLAHFDDGYSPAATVTGGLAIY